MGVSYRQRDVLPMPPLASSNMPPANSTSRCTARRLGRKGHHRDWENDAITALNMLGGRGLSEPEPGAVLGSGTARASAHVSSAFSALGPPDSDINPQGALTELLQNAGL